MNSVGQAAPLRDILKIVRQLSRFGVVGLVATFLHLSVFSLLAHAEVTGASLANLIGFLVAFLFSFVGQSYWTFPSERSDRAERHRRFLRYIIVALVGFLLNAGTVHVIVDLLHHPYTYALPIMAVCVPAVLFILNKYWAFADIRKE